VRLEVGLTVIASKRAVRVRLYSQNSSQSEGVSHLEAWVRLGRGIPHVKGHTSVLQLRYSKEFMGKYLHGQMSSGQMSFWANVLLGKRPSGQTSLSD
jgi:hypothetical protein